MNREDLFIKKENENNQEYILDNLRRRTSKLSVKDYLVHIINLKVVPIGFDRKKDTIAIYGDRLGYFTKLLSEYYNIISIGTMTALPMKEGWKLGVHFMTYRKWYRKIAEGYMNHDNGTIDQQITEMERLFKKTGVKFVIVTDLYPVIQRAVCLAAKNLNIPLAHYEHTSLLNLTKDPYASKFYQEHAKDYVDFYWYWSQKNMDTIVNFGIATEENSTVIGYPYKVDRLDIEKKKSVIWIGDGETHDSKTPEVYYTVVRQIYEHCKEKHIEFVYRPHKKEKKEFYMPLVEEGMKLSHHSLAEDLEGNYVVIGGKTTCLLEAGLYEDVVFQVLWDHAIVDHFLFENAYILSTNKEEVLQSIDDALCGKIPAKKVKEYNLLISEQGKLARDTIEKNIRQFKGQE